MAKETPRCASRSTSAGSSPSRQQATPELKPSRTRAKLPDFEYPSPFVVRNTFLDEKALLPQSLLEFVRQREAQSCPASGASGVSAAETSEGPEGWKDLEQLPFVVRNTFLEAPEAPGSMMDFFQERQAQSCPASGIAGPPPGLQEVDEEEEEGAWAQSPEAFLPDSFSFPEALIPPAPLAPPVLPPFMAEPCPPPSWSAAEPSVPPPVPPPPATFAEAAPPRAPLRLAEALEPALGSAEMPTVGSAKHRFGGCKPCAFLYTKGCASGVDCTFCHLCAPGEKKRRQRAKHQAGKFLSNMDPALAAALAANAAPVPPLYAPPPYVYS